MKTTIDSPVGPLTLVERDGALAGLYMVEHRHMPALPDDEDPRILPAAREQLAAYFDGTLQDFDVEVFAAGTPFQEAVWKGLRQIPYGETWSYRDLAEHLGNPKAVRAVGLANGRNPVSIVVPCHRVVGANGSLTGYGGGLERKQWLLAHEAGSARDPRRGGPGPTQP